MVSQSEALDLVAEILEVPVSDVPTSADLEELGWDSLADLSFIAAADERYGITIDPQRLAERETAADLVALLA